MYCDEIFDKAKSLPFRKLAVCTIGIRDVPRER